TKVYSNSWVALRDINLQINKGEFVFIQGPTGAGKTTILKLIYREELPTRGEVIIQNRKLRELSPKEIPHLRRHIGIVFQDFKLLSDRTVYENLEFALAAINFPRTRMEEVIIKTLTQLGIGNKIENYPHQLSGGEQQKVAIARALAKDPEIILADEPTGNIDPESAEEIIKIFLELANQGKTVIMATHNTEWPKVLKKRTVKLVAGRIVEDLIPG
ncbi:MAG: ATP-binding cassette domain-containing protein, partial [candidate division WOR-3 bacterium]